MISSEFAPNESREDAVLAIRLFFQPWKWRRGKETNNLKRRLKSRFFSADSHISFFLSAHGALYQYIKALSLPVESEVLISGSTPITYLLPILEHQITPVYVDIHKDDFSMNMLDLEKKYSSKAKLLILKHPYGIIPKDRKKILSFAKEKKLSVIEDISQGFDTKLYKNKRFTTTLLMSFSQTAAISSVLGGAIITRGKKNADLMRDVEKNIPNASFWTLLQIIFYKIGSVIIKKTYNLYFGKLLHFVMKHFNLMPTTMTSKEMKGLFDPLYLKIYPNICVIFLMKQLDRFNDVVSRRKKSSTLYSKKLTVNNFSDASLSYFPLTVSNPIKTQKKLKQQNIILSTEQYTLQNQQINYHMYGYSQKMCPVCEQHIPNILKLPTTVSKKDALKLITTVKKVISSKKQS